MKMPPTRSVDIDVIAADLRRRDLDTLDYANSRMTDLEAIFLAGRFSINKSVTAINLAYNLIGDDGIRMLAESLKEQKTVKRIDITDNPFGDVGVLALADLKAERGPDFSIIGIDLEEKAVLQARKRQYVQSLESANNIVSGRADDGEELNDKSLWSERSGINRGGSVRPR